MSSCIVCGCEFNGGFFSLFSSVNACQKCDEKMDSYIDSAEAALNDENFDLSEQEQILQIFTQGNLKRFLAQLSST